MIDNPTLQVLNNRVSLRVYEQREISQETLDVILEAMMRAPTAGNQMLYSVIVVRDQKTKEILAQTCDHQAFIATAPVILIFLADISAGLITTASMEWPNIAIARGCSLKRRRNPTCCWPSRTQ